MTDKGLPVSAGKGKVMARLGLSGDDGEQVYRLMLSEAARGRDRVSKNPENLDPSLRNCQVQAPYEWNQISTTARHREVLYIAEYASPYTRPYFQMGRYTTTVEVENWVAQWFLWHSFRYRDNRPQNSSNHHGAQAG